MDRRAKATQHRDKAARLNGELGLGAAQARYSDDGHWYATLERFPAVLFDANGYVLFQTKADYETSPHIQIGRQISVPKPGISAIPGYVRLTDSTTAVRIDVDVDVVSSDEGQRQRRTQTFASRSNLSSTHPVRMRWIAAQSVLTIRSLNSDWLRVRVDGQSHLRIFFGRLIVATLEGGYVWLALDEAALGQDADQLQSWRWDEADLRPRDAKSAAYPRYKRPESRNGFYDPARDPDGDEWRRIEQAHHAYLRRVNVEGRAPDPRTQSTPGLLDEIATWGTTNERPTEVSEPASQRYEMQNVPSAGEFVRALTALGSRVTDEHRALFRAHYAAPNRTATAKQLADRAGVKGGWTVVNGRYGKLGHALCDELGIKPTLRLNDTHRWWSVWSRGWHTREGFVWQMLPNVAEALERLGWVDAATDFVLPDEVFTSTPLMEGATKPVVVNAYERNAEARRLCLKAHGNECCICGFNFGEVYGSEVSGYIHVHHVRPLSEIGHEYVVDPAADLRPVCPNCHAVIHARTPARSIDEVREMLRLTTSQASAESPEP